MKKPFLYALFAACLTASAAHADTVNFTLNPSTAATTPGGTVTYMATISAPATNGAPVYLNGDSITLADPNASYNDDGLFANFLGSLSPGGSDTEELFTVTVASGELPGTYSGYYLLQGGADGNAQDVIGTQEFSYTVNAASSTSVTPEPPSVLLLFTGVLGVAGFGLRKRLTS